MILITILTVIHVIVCLFLMIVVLLQSGKAADLAGAFGGMGSQTAFGPRGAATILSKATTVAAGLFMVTSLTLSILATRGAGSGSGVKSVLESSKAPAQQQPQQPAAPAPGQAPPPGAPIAPGTPTVTLSTEGGKEETIPLQIPPRPGEKGSPQPSQPPAPAPAKK